jgi:DNA-binding response OmpR family regulator
MKMDSERLLQGCRVLVVEDEPVIALYIVRTLRMAGADVLGPALTLKRAIELTRAEHFDCAVLDLMLRDGFVFRAARLLRHQGAGLVFYTRYVGLVDRLQRALPGAQVLPKPAPPELLVEAVRAACSR